MKYLDRVANIAIILAVAVFLGLVIRSEMAHPTKRIEASPHLLLGKVITLPGVRLSQQRQSIVIALSTQCHFCQESLPFYKHLAQTAEGKLDVIAVLPQPLPAAESFVEQASIRTTHVLSANLGSLGIFATPTVLIVNGKGEIKNAWVGLLDDKSQQQVLSHIQ